MKTFAIIDKQSLEVIGTYESVVKLDTTQHQSWLRAEPKCAHSEVPNNLNPKYIKGELQQGEYIVVFSQEKEDADIESAWDLLRAERNRRLQECDWTQLPDSPLSVSQKNEWKSYRDELRDLPSNVGDPRDQIDWPEQPN